ncbi:hypothetical protein BDN67DRAFT_502483 [Paxillus ammoniavirescens]|nr:hypothetical protein BDN67DRAFT_502483 [Paxillus ammoniavirescens]
MTGCVSPRTNSRFVASRVQRIECGRDSTLSVAQAAVSCSRLFRSVLARWHSQEASNQWNVKYMTASLSCCTMPYINIIAKLLPAQSSHTTPSTNFSGHSIYYAPASLSPCLLTYWNQNSGQKILASASLPIIYRLGISMSLPYARRLSISRKPRSFHLNLVVKAAWWFHRSRRDSNRLFSDQA